MIAIRGAITIECDEEREIIDKTKRLLTRLLFDNDLTLEEVISVDFSVTADITKAYPAVAARQLGLVRAALNCYQQMRVEGELARCIRVCLYADVSIKQLFVKHVYLEGAKQLRPDLRNN